MSNSPKITSYHKILQQEVTRKQFIQVMALAIVSLMGFNNLLQLLTGAGKAARPDSVRHGFGSNKFGV